MIEEEVEETDLGGIFKSVENDGAGKLDNSVGGIDTEDVIFQPPLQIRTFTMVNIPLP
jgi:hypothetical protein